MSASMCNIYACTSYVGGLQEVSIGNEEQNQNAAAHQDERRRSGRVVIGGRRGIRGEKTRVAGAR